MRSFDKEVFSVLSKRLLRIVVWSKNQITRWHRRVPQSKLLYLFSWRKGASGEDSRNR